MSERWRKAKIMDVVEPITTIDPRRRPNDPFDYVDVSSISRTTFSIQETSTLLGCDAPSRARRLMRSGDVLFATIRPTLQRIAIVPDHLDGAVCSTGYFVLRPKGEVLGRFLFHYLFSQRFSDEMAMLQRGASYPAVSDRDVKEHLMPLPPLPEQKRIVAILDEAFAAITTATANAEKNLANVRELFESYLQGVFANPGDGWVEKTLGDACTFSSGGTPSKKNKAYWKGNIPWVSGRDMKNDRIGDATLHVSETAVEKSATRIAPVGSLLILVRGMGLANGIPIAELVSPCAFNQDIRAIHPEPNVDPRFLLWALQSSFSRSDRILNKAAHGTLKINMDDLRGLSISFPLPATQKLLVARIDEIYSDTRHLESIYHQKLASFAELRQSILHKAFTGELTAEPNVADRTLSEAGL